MATAPGGAVGEAAEESEAVGADGADEVEGRLDRGEGPQPRPDHRDQRRVHQTDLRDLLRRETVGEEGCGWVCLGGGRGLGVGVGGWMGNINGFFRTETRVHEGGEGVGDVSLGGMGGLKIAQSFVTFFFNVFRRRSRLRSISCCS